MTLTKVNIIPADGKRITSTLVRDRKQYKGVYKNRTVLNRIKKDNYV